MRSQHIKVLHALSTLVAVPVHDVSAANVHIRIFFDKDGKIKSIAQ